jgi:ring-1,2-phenylacetyl-CoA epoxidase subunit PaaE
VKQYTLTIQEIRKETKDTITLCFEQPCLRKVKYLAGQYATLFFRIDGRKYARPYSFSSAPSLDDTLNVTVKRVSKGIVSNYINNVLKVGDVIEVLEPMGDFTFDCTKPEKSIYLWGVGSGITPLYSILKEVLNTHPTRPVYLIYGNKNQESTIFKSQLNLLKQEYPNIFSMTNFYSQEDIGDDSNVNYKGRINSDFVSRLLTQHDNINESVHYICGPSGLKNIITSSLIEFGIPATSVFVEDFELVIDPKDLEQIEDSNVTVFFNGKSSQIFVPKGKSILDVALDNDIEIPYSCQTGNCSTCKAKLKEGQLKMLGLTKERVDLAKDEFLLCCSYPLTKAINLEVI